MLVLEHISVQEKAILKKKMTNRASAYHLVKVYVLWWLKLMFYVIVKFNVLWKISCYCHENLLDTENLRLVFFSVNLQ